jgi:hypothetical protein
MWRAISGTIVITTMLALGLGPTSAQSQQISRGSGSSSNASTAGLVEGTVKSVDPQTGTVHVSTGLFGFFGKTLQLSEGTEVQIDGRLGSLREPRSKLPMRCEMGRMWQPISSSHRACDANNTELLAQKLGKSLSGM